MQKNIAFHLILDIGRFYSLDSISCMRYDQEYMEFWITFCKFSKVRGYIFCEATREGVWDVLVPVSHPKNAKSILQYLRLRR